MNIAKIEIDFSPEAKQLLADLLMSIGKLSTSESQPAVSLAEEHPVECPFEPAEAPAPAPAKSYSIDDIRSAVMALSRKGADTKAKVKAALNKYAESVPKLAETDYAAFMADLEAIA